MSASHRILVARRVWSAPTARTIAFRPAVRPPPPPPLHCSATCTRSVCRTRPSRNVGRTTQAGTDASTAAAAPSIVPPGDPDKWLYKRAMQSAARGLTQCRHCIQTIVQSSASSGDGQPAYLQRPLSALAAVALRLQETRLCRNCGAALRQFVQQSEEAKRQRDEYVQHVRGLKGDEKP